MILAATDDIFNLSSLLLIPPERKAETKLL